VDVNAHALRGQDDEAARRWDVSAPRSRGQPAKKSPITIGCAACPQAFFLWSMPLRPLKILLSTAANAIKSLKSSRPMMGIIGHMNTTAGTAGTSTEDPPRTPESLRTHHSDLAAFFRDFLLMSGRLHFPLDRRNERRQLE
jgi:hypothetical protein